MPSSGLSGKARQGTAGGRRATQEGCWLREASGSPWGRAQPEGDARPVAAHPPPNTRAHPAVGSSLPRPASHPPLRPTVSQLRPDTYGHPAFSRLTHLHPNLPPTSHFHLVSSSHNPDLSSSLPFLPLLTLTDTVSLTRTHKPPPAHRFPSLSLDLPALFGRRDTSLRPLAPKPAPPSFPARGTGLLMGGARPLLVRRGEAQVSFCS